MKINTRLIICIVMMFCSIQIGFGQTTKKKDYYFDPNGKSFALQRGQPLTASINNLGPYDVVCIEPQATTTNTKNFSVTLRAWVITYGSDADQALLEMTRVENIAALPETNYSYNNGTLNLDGGLETNKRIVIHLSVPAGVRGKISVNGRSLYDGSFSPNIMIQNGKSFVSDHGYDPNAAIIQALQGKLAGKQLTIAAKDVHEIDWRTLRSLSAKSVTPVTTALSNISAGQNWSIVEVNIDETGIVRSVSHVAGNEKLSSAAFDTLWQYQFRSFVINDVPVKIKSVIPVVYKQGQIVLFSEDK